MTLADIPSIGCGVPIWHIYADGREFGKDYPSRAMADEIVAVYRSHFPGIAYEVVEVRCMDRYDGTLNTSDPTFGLHGFPKHEYVSLMVPCLHCTSAIAWSAGEWRDSTGSPVAGGGHVHVPDPGYVA